MTRLASAALAVAAICLSMPMPAVAQAGRVTGSVTYRERIALPPTAVVEVTLEDVSRPGTPPLVLASARIEKPGQVPVRFSLGYNPKSIDGARRYAVRAQITDGRAVLFDTTDPVLVLTQGHDDVADLILTRVSPAATVPERREAPALPPMPVTNLPATFAGQLACADCPGIRYHLNLYPDDSFVLKTTRLGSGGSATDTIGTWGLSSDRRMLFLASEQANGEPMIRVFAAPGGGVLRPVDEDMLVKGRAPGDLRRTGQFQPLAIRSTFKGAYVSVDSGQTFIECSTGQRWPVAGELGIRTDLESGYRKARSGAGAAVLVELEGRVAMTGAGAARTATFTPERIVRWLPRERCAPRFASAPLERTEWRLTHIAGNAVPAVADRRREPSISFDEPSGTFSATTGCNRLAGHYWVEHASIELEPGGTLTACREDTRMETAMVTMIRNTRTFRVTGRVLELFDEKNARLARFEAR